MIQALLGRKQTQSQKFLTDGSRIPITSIWAGDNFIVKIMDQKVQLGFETTKKATKATQGNIKKAGIDKNLRFFRELPATDTQNLTQGSVVKASDVLKPGDLVTVMGISKGKGFAGGVKRHHFKGGPRTHGQSDRERAPGSIGQTTTPGRVYKGKRMAGRMGTDRITVKNLSVLNVTDDQILLSGLVPGGKNSLLTITKVKEDKNILRKLKKFVPLLQEKVEEDVTMSNEVITKGVSSTETDAEETKEPQVAVTTKEEKTGSSETMIETPSEEAAGKVEEVK